MVHGRVSNKSGESECWRCILCGEYVDPVILDNRKHQKTIRENGGGNKQGPAYPESAEEAAPLTYEDIMDFFSSD